MSRELELETVRFWVMLHSRLAGTPRPGRSGRSETTRPIRTRTARSRHRSSLRLAAVETPSSLRTIDELGVVLQTALSVGLGVVLGVLLPPLGVVVDTVLLSKLRHLPLATAQT